MISRKGSVASARLSMYSMRGEDLARKDVSIYKGVSDRPRGWKPRRSLTATVGQVSRDAKIKKWNGPMRRTVEWDGLRKDPDLWFDHGNCYVHLYGRGSSRRGPAFKVPFDALLNARCRPLIDRYLVDDFEQSPTSEYSSSEHGGQFGDTPGQIRYDLYIPAPQNDERCPALLYHIATRNFFAWVFGKSMVGSHLGGALVGLLNSMDEFRTEDSDNVEDILQYMDEEGYADMDSYPDHALAVLYFAEHYQFENLWIDAFAHCAGMNDRLADSTELEHIGHQSRSLVARARAEMGIRLDRCGKALSTFLEDDLLKVNQSLPELGRVELDRFRAFLQAYYVAKLGYYPPPSTLGNLSTAFPKHILETMRYEFESLYNYLVDTSSTSEPTLESSDSGIPVLKQVQFFDLLHRYQPLPHRVPLLPDANSDSTPRSGLFSWSSKLDKLKLDDRLIVVSSLAKATNRRDVELLDCTLVRAFRGYEKQAVFSKIDGRKKRISQTEARKVRWILVYSMLQTLLSATRVPEQVSNKDPSIPYHMSVLTAGCPPWTNNKSQGKANKETENRRHSFVTDPFFPSTNSPSSYHPYDVVPTLYHPTPPRSRAETTPVPNRQGNVRRAISALGNMPELRHPTPVRNSYHEILINEYGNGLTPVLAQLSISTTPRPGPSPVPTSSNTPSPATTTSSTFSAPTNSKSHIRSTSDITHSDSATTTEDLSHWSRSSSESTRPSSVDSDHNSSSFPSSDSLPPPFPKINTSMRDLFDHPIHAFLKRSNTPSSSYSTDIAVPAPLSVPSRKSVMIVTQEVSVQYDSIAPTVEEVPGAERLFNVEAF